MQHGLITPTISGASDGVTSVETPICGMGPLLSYQLAWNSGVGVGVAVAPGPGGLHFFFFFFTQHLTLILLCAYQHGPRCPWTLGVRQIV